MEQSKKLYNISWSSYKIISNWPKDAVQINVNFLYKKLGCNISNIKKLKNI